MAVVQISKIQVRRGQKNSGIGIPQLSSGEIAWAIDAQELYIGNGSIVEGAPYVGNTRILTEQDNILEVARGYRFSGTDNSLTGSIERSVQTKLDEYVSVADFGAVADGVTDSTAAFQLALDQLFFNINPKFKKTLIVPNGEYLIQGTLKIPGHAILQGETKLGAILNIDSNNIIFLNNDGSDSIEDFNSFNRPINVVFRNLTIKRTTGSINLAALAKSSFERVKFLGTYELASPIEDFSEINPMIFWENELDGIKTTDITFNACEFDSIEMAIKCSQLSENSLFMATDLLFEDCEFHHCDTAVYIETYESLFRQRYDWLFKGCKFENISAKVIKTVGPSQGIIFDQSSFINCGNGNSVTPIMDFVSFESEYGNLLKSCYSDRHRKSNSAEIGLSNFNGEIFEIIPVPEVTNASIAEFDDIVSSSIVLSDSIKSLTVFSSTYKFINLEYSLRLGSGIRQGLIAITVGGDSVSITDNYNFSPEGQLMSDFEFIAQLRDNDSDSTNETVVLYYRNPQSSGQTGTISYRIRYGV